MQNFCLSVKGDFACFTRPEMKIERVSYDVITPSASRAIFGSILWKPAFSWHINRIEVLSPVKWFSIRRNEVSKLALTSGNGIFVDDSATRQQRASLILRDVHYRIHASLEFLPFDKWHKTPNPKPMNNDQPGESEAKYLAMFERRALKGQCFNQPYLGCREFSADVRLVTDLDAERKEYPPISATMDLGWMLYDIDYDNGKKMLLYRPNMINGVIEVPQRDSEAVIG